MPAQFVMRAFKITFPTGHVYWASVGSPDFSGTFSGFNPSELTSITVDYSTTTPTLGSGNFLAPQTEITFIQNDADLVITSDVLDISVGMRALSTNRTVTLPLLPVLGQQVTVKDLDGSIAFHNIIINANGNTIDGAATYTMTDSINGSRSSITMVFFGTTDKWGIV